MSPDARAASRRLVKLSNHILCTTQPEKLLLSWRRASSTDMISSTPSRPPVRCPPSAGSTASAGRPVTAPRPVMRQTLQAREPVQALPAWPLVIRHRNALLQRARQLSTEGTDQERTFITKKPQPSTFSLSMARLTFSSAMGFALDPLLRCTSNTHYSPRITARLISGQYTVFGPVLPSYICA